MACQMKYDVRAIWHPIGQIFQDIASYPGTLKLVKPDSDLEQAPIWHGQDDMPETVQGGRQCCSAAGLRYYIPNLVLKMAFTLSEAMTSFPLTSHQAWS